MLVGYDAFYIILGRVRDAIVAELQNNPTSDPPARVGIVPGAIAWDGCTDCGQLALSSFRYYLTDSLPSEVGGSDISSGGFLAADLVAQIIRCAPQPTGSSLAPSVAALDTSARVTLNDAFSLDCATRTALAVMYNSGDIMTYVMRPVTFVGPEGACVGSELLFSVAIAT